MLHKKCVLTGFRLAVNVYDNKKRTLASKGYKIRLVALRLTVKKEQTLKCHWEENSKVYFGQILSQNIAFCSYFPQKTEQQTFHCNIF